MYASSDNDANLVHTPAAEGAPPHFHTHLSELLDRAHRGEASFDEILGTRERFGNHYVENPAWTAARGLSEFGWPSRAPAAPAPSPARRCRPAPAR